MSKSNNKKVLKKGNKKMAKRKKTPNKSNRTKRLISIILLVFVLSIVSFFIFSKDYFNLRDSNADTKRYSKRYPAGKIVTY